MPKFETIKCNKLILNNNSNPAIAQLQAITLLIFFKFYQPLIRLIVGIFDQCLFLYRRLDEYDATKLGLLTSADTWYLGSPDSHTNPGFPCVEDYDERTTTISVSECAGKAEAVSFTKCYRVRSPISNSSTKIC